jgi:hypothetical protein
MENNEQRRQFINELWRRFEEVQQWAIEHWPDPAHPLSPADFVEARKTILGLGNMTSELNKQEPEPSAGGPQYIDTTPAPWP